MPGITSTFPEQSTHRTRCSLPAVLMRAGTSKGLFLHRHHLPTSQKDWALPLLAAMGSRNSDVRQIDGVGGATSTTSKVAVVSPSSRPGVDIDYTFVQVAIGQESVDFTGNCGNMASGVGPFALQEGLVHAKPGQRKMDVRIFNTNTSRLIVETIEVDQEGCFDEDGSYSIPGVKGTGSEIKVAFVDPAGSMTGKLFPTDHHTDTIDVTDGIGSHFSVEATLIDAANPFVVVDESTLPDYLRDCEKDGLYLERMELIRRHGAVLMGLANSVQEAAKVKGTPKLAIVSPPKEPTDAAGVFVQSLSMGKLHPSLQLTGAACLAVAVRIEGTVANRVSRLKTAAANHSPASERISVSECQSSDDEDGQVVRLFHSSGSIEVEVVTSGSGSDVVAKSCVLSRTARRLFEGTVFYYK